MAKNSFRGWSLKEPGGHITSTVYESKTKTIDFITGLSSKRIWEVNRRRGMWQEAYKIGWRVVPVLVTEIPQSEGGQHEH